MPSTTSTATTQASQPTNPPTSITSSKSVIGKGTDDGGGKAQTAVIRVSNGTQMKRLEKFVVYHKTRF